MTGIPYNYGKYIDDTVRLKDQGVVDAKKQVQSPASAGSRGLTKTTQFTKDKTQMKMGNSPIAESMVEIRNILNRIDGVNAPVQEAPKDSDIDYAKLMLQISAMKDKIAELPIDDDRKTSALTALGQVEDDLAMDESAVQEDAGEDEKVVDMLRNIKQHLENHPNMSEHPSLVALDQLADDLESGDKPADYESTLEDADELSRLKELSGIREDAGLTDEQKKGLEAIAKKYKDREGGNGDMLAYGYLDVSDTGIPTDGYDKEEMEAYSKKIGVDWREWDGEQSEDFLEQSKITDEMIDDLLKILGQNFMNDSKLQFRAMEYLDSLDNNYEPFPEGDEFDIEEDEDFEEVLGPLGFPEDETELFDAEYQGRKVPLNKPMRGDTKKFKVYVKDPKTGNVKKVNFGHGGTSAKRKTMRIRKSNPKARKSFRARHNCANPGPKTKARYWSCRKW